MEKKHESLSLWTIIGLIAAVAAVVASITTAMIIIKKKENYKIIDKKSMLTEINDKGENVPEGKQKELIAKVEKLSKEADIAVMSGSLPKGVNADFYGEVLGSIPETVKVIVDAEKANTFT